MSEVLDLKRRNKIQTAPDKIFSAEEEFLLPKKEKRKFGKLQWIIAILAVIILSTAGIKASDTLFGAKDQVKSLCPEEMVFVPGSNGGFCVDKYENSAGDKCQNNNPSSEQDSQKNIDDPNCQAVSAAKAVPWRNLTQIQAATLCAKAGKRLPTSEEWFSASLGTPDKDSNWGLDDCQVNNNWIQQPGLTGSGKNCVSYAGAYDMVGNVWEWVKGEINSGVYGNIKMPDNGYVQAVSIDGLPTKTDPDNASEIYKNDYLWIKSDGERGIARGGYWGNGNEAGLYSFYAVTEPNLSAVGVGFRCVK
jgi:formylglycine-generating enzyme required for sulfatase activity